jgi:hypothetical protein
MTTEQKIREAFEKAKAKRMVLPESEKGDLGYYLFKAGYLALLNELEPEVTGNNFIVYILPDGVTK